MPEPDDRRTPDTGGTGGDRLLAGAGGTTEASRSVLLEAMTRVVHPTTLVLAAYLLLVGLHRPGGGFAAGLVIGLGLVLRRIAGGPHELGAATRLPPGVLLGAGLVLASGYALAGLVLSGDLLHGTVLTVALPLLPPHELPTSLVLEIGVLLIVVGLTLDVLRTLGGDPAP